MEVRAISLTHTLDEKSFPDSHAQLIALSKAFANPRIRTAFKDSSIKDKFIQSQQNCVKKLAQELYEISSKLFCDVTDADLGNANDKILSESTKPLRIFGEKIRCLILEDVFSTTDSSEQLAILESWIAVLQRSVEVGDFFSSITILGVFNNPDISRLKFDAYYSATAKKVLSSDLLKPSTTVLACGNREDLVIPHHGYYKAMLTNVDSGEERNEDKTLEALQQLYDKWIDKLFQESLSQLPVIATLYATKKAIDDKKAKLNALLTPLKQKLDALKQSEKKLSEEEKKTFPAQVLNLENEILKLNRESMLILNPRRELWDQFLASERDIFISVKPEIFNAYNSEKEKILSLKNKKNFAQNNIFVHIRNELINFKPQLRPGLVPAFNEFQKFILADNINIEELDKKFAEASEKIRGRDNSSLAGFFAEPFDYCLNAEFSPAIALIPEAISLLRKKTEALGKFDRFCLSLPADTDLKQIAELILLKLEARMIPKQAVDFIKFQSRLTRDPLRAELKKLLKVYVELDRVFNAISKSGHFQENLVTPMDFLKKSQETPSGSGFLGTLRRGSSILFGHKSSDAAARVPTPAAASSSPSAAAASSSTLPTKAPLTRSSASVSSLPVTRATLPTSSSPMSVAGSSAKPAASIPIKSSAESREQQQRFFGPSNQAGDKKRTSQSPRRQPIQRTNSKDKSSQRPK